VTTWIIAGAIFLALLGGGVLLVVALVQQVRTSATVKAQLKAERNARAVEGEMGGKVLRPDDPSGDVGRLRDHGF
jgi:hypothetical protein